MIYKTTIIKQKWVAKNTLEISLKRPDNFSFKAGQYIQLSVPNLFRKDVKGKSRVFSIVSSPLDKNIITIAFRDTGSGFKYTLKELSLGDVVNITGPYGFFTIPLNSSNSFVFIAGGIGITPYLSMIRFATEKNITFPITLLYANRDKESTAYLNELKEIENKNNYFTFQSKFGKIDEKFLWQGIKNTKQCLYHIAGPPAMIDYVRNMLILMGVDNSQIYYEAFAGY